MNPQPLATWTSLRLTAAAKALAANGFGVHTAGSAQEAFDLVLHTLLAQWATASAQPPVISFGGSMSCAPLVEELRRRAAQGQASIIDTVDYSLPREEQMERRRQGLLADVFIMGTNAVTMDGKLVNLDNLGNRVGALHFGPRSVIVLAGRNKLENTVEEAMARVKRVAAPANAIRLERKTPCVKTGECHDCKSPERICSVWTITEKCMPAGRIQVVLVDEDLGL